MFRKLDKVQNKRVWRLGPILLAEFIGTFLMIFEIIAPSALDLANNTVWYNQIFGTFLMKAFWVAGFILILILLLRWVSCNLNPVVTLAEVAVGNTSKQQAAWMIVFQMIAGVLAAVFAYYLATHITVTGNATDGFTWTFAKTTTIANSIWGTIPDGTQNMDAVYPILKFSNNEQAWVSGINDYNVIFPGIIDGTTAVFGLWTAGVTSGNVFGITSTAWGFLGITFLLEVIYTWLLLWSVVGAKKLSNGFRPFLIFLVLMLVVTLGIHTNNIALNPARLIGPAVVTQFVGGIHTLQYVLVFLAGELVAALLVARTAGKREYKAVAKGQMPARGAAVSFEGAEAFKAEVKVAVLGIRNDLEGTKGRYKWVLEGNNPIESMDEAAIKQAIKKAKADKAIDTNLELNELKRELSLFLSLGANGYKAAKKDLEDAVIAVAKIEEEAKAKEDKKDAKKAKKEVKEEASEKEADKKVSKKAPAKK